MNNNTYNLIIAVVLSVSIILGWQYLYEKPRLRQIEQQQIAKQKQLNSITTTNVSKEKIVETDLGQNHNIIQSNKRINIKSKTLEGSIRLHGLRFDDLTLLEYKEDLSKNSSNVSLLSDTTKEKSYFVEVGWYSSQEDIELPNSETLWHSDDKELTDINDVSLYWVNSKGVKFLVKLSLDQDYMFNIKQSIENTSNDDINIQNYGIINRKYDSNAKSSVNILHEGPIACENGELIESSFQNVKDKKSQKFKSSSIDWIGITDKYWLTTIIPDKNISYNSNFTYAHKSGFEIFQVDFVSNKINIKPGEVYDISHQLFTGPKKVDLLDYYAKKYNITLFDRAIDFGWFYLITKPIFTMMNFFYKYVGNFGISILIVTIIIKLLMFNLANKSYRAMKKMKEMQPELERIKERYSSDKMRVNQEILALYKSQKINPASGFLTILIQIPVFFALYKVLYVTIEMRQAPFFGWIYDLSAPDPTSIFNLFGLLSFTPPQMLMIGAWPIIMALTMFLQQKMSPAPADPVQANVMRLMPLMFLIMFSNFPVGLIIYWSWNNILSILQQYYINKLGNNIK
jgi:YidC/Oxa1 family membrane protein insertase